jgi:hypothetical protein
MDSQMVHGSEEAMVLVTGSLLVSLEGAVRILTQVTADLWRS